MLKFNYIWNRKTHYIRKGTLVKGYEEGGLKAIDIDCINGTIKINWLRSFLKNENSLWFHIPNWIFNDLGGVTFLLRCDLDLNKLPVKLSAFHQQVLHYWKMIYRHNFSPHNTLLWNCRYILSRNKSFFFLIKIGLEKGIWSVMHLLDNTGNTEPFEILCSKCSLNDKRQSNNLVKAIPQSIVVMSYNLCHNITDLKLPNSTIRHTLVKELYPFSTNSITIPQVFSKKEVESLRSKFHIYNTTGYSLNCPISQF